MQPDSLDWKVLWDPCRVIGAFEVSLRRGESRQPIRMDHARCTEACWVDQRHSKPAGCPLEFVQMTSADPCRAREGDDAGVLRPKPRPVHLHVAPRGDRSERMPRVS